MVGIARQGVPSWMTTATAVANTKAVDSNTTSSSVFPSKVESFDSSSASVPSSYVDLGLAERAVSAAGAAVLSALIVNPLDVAKTRLQAQAAGVPYGGLCDPSCLDAKTMIPGLKSSSLPCTPECNRYKGTIDVLYRVTQQEGFARLWRGTNASLALAVPTVGIYLPCYDVFRNILEDFTNKHSPALIPYVPLVAGSAARSLACVTFYPVELARTRMQAFNETRSGVKPPGVWKTLVQVINPVAGTNNLHQRQSYRILWTGLGVQLARDVPFSAICWSTLEPIRRQIIGLMGDEPKAAGVLGANFSAGFVAGTIAAAATCPLDVAKTRRQIEKDTNRQLHMTTRKTLVEIWRDGGVRGLFTGIGPRVARAGPSVGIVVSFYEVVKYMLLHRRHLNTD